MKWCHVNTAYWVTLVSQHKNKKTVFLNIKLFIIVASDDLLISRFHASVSQFFREMFWWINRPSLTSDKKQLQESPREDEKLWNLKGPYVALEKYVCNSVHSAQ